MVTFRLQVSCNWTYRRAMWRLISLFQPPPRPWPGFPLGSQTKIHLVIAAIRLQTYCKYFVREHRYPRLCPRSQDHEVISFALPGMGPQSLLPMIRLTEFHPFGYHICPDVSEKCCDAGEDLAECLGVLHVPIQFDEDFIRNFWRLRPDSPGAVAFVAT